jgi:hypothetical protein
VISYNGKKLTLNKDYVLKYYKDAGFTKDNEVSAAEIIKNAGDVYYILPVAKDGSNFDGAMSAEQAVEVCGTDSRTAVAIGKLKVVNNKGKAVKVDYDSENAVDVASLFAPTEGKEATAFVMDGKTTLTYGTDYEVRAVAGDDYKSAGVHSFILTGLERNLSPEEITAGKKSYVGEKVMTFEITGVSMKSVKIAGLMTTVQYTGSSIELADLFNPADKVVKSRNASIDNGAPGEKTTSVLLYYSQKIKSGGRTVNMLIPLNPGSDYTYSMENTGNAGKFTLTFTGT